MEINYDEDMRIDESALDVEWLGQAQLAIRYARHLAACADKVRHLEEQKKTKRSEIIVLVNSDPDTYCGKSKPNAADIEAAYRTDSGYIRIIEQLLVAQGELQFAELARSEIAFTRRQALENLVKLHGQQYFAGPSVPHDLSKEWEKREKMRAVNEGVSRKLRRGNAKK